MMMEQSLKCRCHNYTLPRSSAFFLPEAKPQFAPDRLIDVEQIKLEISVDLPSKTLKGSCTTAFRGVAPLVGKLTFDAIDLKVDQVLDQNGAELSFDQTSEKLFVYLNKGLAEGEHSSISIRYHVTEPRAGLYFIAPDKDYPSKPWQLWTQGQDQDNRYWIPCHDAPNEKAATEMIVTVSDKYTAISNGKLLSSTHDAKKGSRTFHWKQAIPHASYLITLCIGEFTELKDVWKNSKGEEIPVQYFTLLGRERETKLAFGKTPKMLDFFSKKIGVDYPYEKYAQVVAWDFVYGGMENTSATTQTEFTLHPEQVEQDYSSEPLVAHELAHQWFGDLLTCKEWSHAWLNEGFATYFETLWTEHEHGRNEFLYELYGNEKIYKAEDGGHYRRPIVTNVYLSPSDIFDRHLYEKGGRVLHMLRKLVGDELWWKAIQRYTKGHFAKTVETVDLQRAFEETTGKSLSWFFEQWVFKGGHPELKASYEWVEEKKLAKLTITQKQKENELTPLFRLPLQFKIATSAGEQTYEVEVTQTEQTFWFQSAEKPKFVSLNPENTVLADIDFSPGRELLITQLTQDLDVMGRVFAAKALSKDHSRQSVDALAGALKTELFWGMQVEIAEALGFIGSSRCKEALLSVATEIAHPKARKSVMKALGQMGGDDVAAVAEKLLKSDQSPLVQYEAGLALGKAKGSGVFDKLSSSLGKRDSWHEYYDRGILMGLAQLRGDERVLPILTKYTKSGQSMFLRRDAIAAMVEFAKAKPALIIDAIIDLTRDADFFVRYSSIAALHSLGEMKASSALRRLADCSVDPRTKRGAIEALKGIRKGSSAQEDMEKLRTDFDKLKDQYRTLLSRVEKIEA